MEVTDEVSKFVTSRSFKEMHSWNIFDIFVTFLVFKFDILREIKEEHNENIKDISFTFSVLNLFKFKVGK